MKPCLEKPKMKKKGKNGVRKCEPQRNKAHVHPVPAVLSSHPSVAVSRLQPTPRHRRSDVKPVNAQGRFAVPQLYLPSASHSACRGRTRVDFSSGWGSVEHQPLAPANYQEVAQKSEERALELFPLHLYCH